MANIGPSCPNCGHDAPLRLLFWGLGKPFACKGCGTELVVPKGHGLRVAASAFVFYWLLKDRMESGLGLAALFVALFLIVGLVSWLTMKPRRTV